MRPIPPRLGTADPRSAGRALPPQRPAQALFSELLGQRELEPVEKRKDEPDTHDEPEKDEELSRDRQPESGVERGREEPSPGIVPAVDCPLDGALPDAPPDEGRTPVLTAAPPLAQDEPWRSAARNLAHTVAAFCNDPAVSNSQDWRVQMELRPDVVVDTTLHLTLSSHRLHLRFHARDPHSHDLLFMGRDELVGILKVSLERTLDIGISFDTA